MVRVQKGTNFRLLGIPTYLKTVKPEEIRHSDTEMCALLDYAPNGYWLWLLEERKIVVGHDIIFDEVTFPSTCSNASTADREADTEKENAEEEDTEEKKLLTYLRVSVLSLDGTCDDTRWNVEMGSNPM
jgi:hypothetical protein